MINHQLFEYISASPTPFQAVSHTAGILDRAGYERLYETDAWSLEKDGKYYVVRNGSSIIAFRTSTVKPFGFRIAAAHCDSPCLKIKDKPELKGNGFLRLSAEMYGGMIRSSWMDRPLSIAGRVLVRTDDGLKSCLVDLKAPCAIIPNLAIHMDRSVNDGKKWNPAVDMLPVYSTLSGENGLESQLADAVHADAQDIIGSDLYVYNPQPGVVVNDLIAAPRLDDLQCAFSALTAFLAAEDGNAIPVCCIFDNEEVGSLTKQGAASTFLQDVLLRINEFLGGGGEQYRRMVAGSFLCSCDNAHGVHPNHPEYSDPNHQAVLNGGVVMKYNANQKYTTDGVSAGIFRRICEKAGVPVQVYANRADLPGGSTLGNLVNANVSLNAVDIGLAQLAMHSAFETAGGNDTEYMIRALKTYYSASITKFEDMSYSIL